MASARGGHSSGKGELSAEGEKARLGCPDVPTQNCMWAGVL